MAALNQRLLIILLLGIAVSQFGHAGYLYAKAELAQRLIASAWQDTLRGDTRVKPWRWADTWPVARLQMYTDTIDEDLYLLAGATGSSLAFGPGHMAGTPLPGGSGSSIVGGHRDTHFAFLAKIETGDTFQLQTKRGLWHSYRVAAINVRDITAGPLLLNPSSTQIQLITCYPFDALSSGGPLRYVVTAVKV